MSTLFLWFNMISYSSHLRECMFHHVMLHVLHVSNHTLPIRYRLAPSVCQFFISDVTPAAAICILLCDAIFLRIQMFWDMTLHKWVI